MNALLIAAAIAVGSMGGVTVTLTDEPCALRAVENLPLRATWREQGETIEGCYTLYEGLAAFYFADRTVWIAPANWFRRARPA